MKILVTGSAGFLSSWLIPALQNAGHYVIGIDRIHENISTECITHNLQMPLARKLEFDSCIHVASSVGGFLFNAKEFDLLSTEETIAHNIIQLCRESNCENFIFLSSINVFENSEIPDEHDELKIFNQKTPYAQSKARIESLFQSQFQNFMILRPTNFFAVNQPRNHCEVGKSHVIPDLLQKIYNEEFLEILGDGSQLRNFIHLSDISTFIIKNIARQGGHHLNLRSDLFLTILELARSLMEITGIHKKIAYRPEYLKYEPVQISRFSQIRPRQLGWIPEINSMACGLMLQRDDHPALAFRQSSQDDSRYGIDLHVHGEAESQMRQSPRQLRPRAIGRNLAEK
jgi:UDP-glucose 4-epimerase